MVFPVRRGRHATSRVNSEFSQEHCRWVLCSSKSTAEDLEINNFSKIKPGKLFSAEPLGNGLLDLGVHGKSMMGILEEGDQV